MYSDSGYRNIENSGVQIVHPMHYINVKSIVQPSTAHRSQARRPPTTTNPKPNPTQSQGQSHSHSQAQAQPSIEPTIKLYHTLLFDVMSSSDPSDFCITEDNSNPFLGFFTGMMSQFMHESMANGSLPAFVGNTAGTATPSDTASHPSPSTVIPYSSSCSQPIALPAAPTGHPLPSRNFLVSVRRSRCLAWVVSLCLTTPTIPAIATVLKTSARPRYPRRTPLAVLQQENILVPLVLPFKFAWGISCAFAHRWQACRLCDPRASTFCAVLIENKSLVMKLSDVDMAYQRAGKPLEVIEDPELWPQRRRKEGSVQITLGCIV
ncbi:hypothetical protein B0H13DRAFT_1858285 [Mycena leptocephala]|nr:hypothetical protein B0H13DRAFT_1858285 [Mycena leptocephala]